MTEQGTGNSQAWLDNLRREGLLPNWPNVSPLPKEDGFHLTGRYVSPAQALFFQRFMKLLKLAYIGGLIFWLATYMNHWGWTSHAFSAFLESFKILQSVLPYLERWDVTAELTGDLYRFLGSDVGSYVYVVQPLIIILVVWFILSQTLRYLYSRARLFWKNLDVIMAKTDVGVGNGLGYQRVQRKQIRGFPTGPHRKNRVEENIDRQRRQRPELNPLTPYIYRDSFEVVISHGMTLLVVAEIYSDKDAAEALGNVLYRLDKMLDMA